MPTEHTAEQDEFVIPEGAGLPSRSDPEREASIPPRGGDELLNAAAAGEKVTPIEHDGLVDYFLANGELPGDTKPVDLSVTLGRGAQAREFHCTLAPITWDEWQDARDRATDKDDKFDVYVQSSWVVARALRRPQLGPTVTRLQRETDNPPRDAADLLRRMFARQSGALLELAGKVLEISGLQDGAASVKEIDAAKN